MNIETGAMYPDLETARRAGEKPDTLVFGTPEALAKLQVKLKFTKGSFKPVAPPEDSDDHAAD